MRTKLPFQRLVILLLLLALSTGCQDRSRPALPETSEQSSAGVGADPVWLEVTHSVREIAGAREISYTVSPVCGSFAPLDGLTELTAYHGQLLGAGYRVNEYLIASGQLFLVDPAAGTMELFGPPLQTEESFYDVAVNAQGEIWTVLGKSYLDLDSQQYCTDYYLAAVSAEGIPDALIPLPDLTGEVAYFSYSGVFPRCCGLTRPERIWAISSPTPRSIPSAARPTGSSIWRCPGRYCTRDMRKSPAKAGLFRQPAGGLLNAKGAQGRPLYYRVVVIRAPLQGLVLHCKGCCGLVCRPYHKMVRERFQPQPFAVLLIS